MVRISIKQTKAGYKVVQKGDKLYGSKIYNLGTFKSKARAKQTASIARKLIR